MSGADTTIFPSVCPHCGHSINYLRPVGLKALEAALAVLCGADSTRSVAEAMGATPRNTAALLNRAYAAGLVAIKGRTTSHDKGGSQLVYAPAQRIAAFYPVQWRAYEAEQRRKRA